MKYLVAVFFTAAIGAGGAMNAYFWWLLGGPYRILAFSFVCVALALIAKFVPIILFGDRHAW